jgi:hypothetical protein
MDARVWALAALALVAAAHARAASRDVQYGPPPAWAAPPPAPTEAVSPEGAPARMVYFDFQTRLGKDDDELYSAYRLKILSPQGLAAGAISATWSPSADDIIVHGLKIIRGDQVIDVLATTRFEVIQRENSLESAVLDGQLTATLQAPGLQVGDELEFAATVRHRDPTLGDRSQGFAQLPVVGAPGAYRLRLLWPEGKTVRWRASPDLGQVTPSERGGQSELTVELRDPKSAVLADGAPMRVNVRRLVEYSGFAGWSEVSSLLWPLFDKAATLARDSPVRLEIARIASSTDSPAERAEAALRLVQDRIRYVYVGLDGGNYRPAGADETWTRRFGDCKAKTVLLLALLRALGVPGEAVLVNAAGGDGLDQRLPSVGVFNHVLVRAKIGSETYWLDGTRLGDRHLATLPPPAFRWALPLRARDASLEAVSPTAPAAPQFVGVLTIDARAGFAAPAKVEAEDVLRGEGAPQLRTQLSSLSPEDAERAEKAFWRNQMNWVEPAATAWRYDEVQNTVVLTMSGEGKPQWEGDDRDGRNLDIEGAGFSPPAPLRRPKEQDQTAPWVTEFPSYKCWVTTIDLPAETARWRWDYVSAPMDETLGGVAYWRRASLRGGVMRTIMSRRAFLPEITAAQAADLNDRLASFDNKISRVFQVAAFRRRPRPEAAATTGVGEAPIDWSSPAAPCAAPSVQAKPVGAPGSRSQQPVAPGS